MSLKEYYENLAATLSDEEKALGGEYYYNIGVQYECGFISTADKKAYLNNKEEIDNFNSARCKDVGEAMRFYTVAIALGNGKAAERLGGLYEFGYEGVVNKDKKKALELYELSLELGNESAQFAIYRSQEEPSIATNGVVI